MDLLYAIKTNGTGLFEGNFRIIGVPVGALNTGNVFQVKFSKDDMRLGEFIVKMFQCSAGTQEDLTNKEVVCLCSLMKNNTEEWPQPITVVLKTFSFNKLGNAGNFVILANY